MTNELKKQTVDWIKEYGGKFVLSETNKLDYELAAIYKTGVIYLCGGRYTSPVFAPKMYISLVGRTMTIQDLLVKDVDIGNGSILMKALFTLCEYWGVNDIVAYLSDIDEDHTERRNHFYEKHEFAIKGNWAKKRL